MSAALGVADISHPVSEMKIVSQSYVLRVPPSPEPQCR